MTLSWMAQAAFVCMISIGSSANAQNNQSATGDGNNVISNRDGFVNLGEINIILNSEAALVSDQSERLVIENLAGLILSLAENGELAVSETAVRALARNAIKELADQPLTRGVISTRQFVVPYQQTKNIAGTNHRITYVRNNCGANAGIIFVFNRDEHCLIGFGGTVLFKEGGTSYELVFDGYADQGRTQAQFTIYPSQ